MMVINNTGGKDREMLKRFKEQAWNYQVVRFFDGDEKEVIPRKAKVNQTAALAKRMVEVLEKQERKVPRGLAELAK